MSLRRTPTGLSGSYEKANGTSIISAFSSRINTEEKTTDRVNTTESDSRGGNIPVLFDHRNSFRRTVCGQVFVSLLGILGLAAGAGLYLLWYWDYTEIMNPY